MTGITFKNYIYPKQVFDFNNILSKYKNTNSSILIGIFKITYNIISNKSNTN